MNKRNGLGLLGLLAVTALGMTAFASSALAVVEPSFTVNGAKATEALDAKFIGNLENKKGSLAIPGLNTEINCEAVEVKGGLILNALDAKVESLLYSGCGVANFTTKAAIPCHVSDVHTGKPDKLHITALNILFLPVEISAGPPVEYGILAENIHVFINFLSGTGCPLPLKTEVKGEVCFLISDTPVKTNDTAKPLIITDENIQKSCPKREVLEGLEKVPPINPTFEDKLLYGAQAAFIIGSAELSLLEPHNGQTLGVLLL